MSLHVPRPAVAVLRRLAVLRLDRAGRQREIPHAARTGTTNPTARPPVRALLLILTLCLAGATTSVRAAQPPTIAAASDLKFALDELVATYAASGGDTPRVAYGSSGNLAQQIIQGAPFDIFMSADEAFVRRLVERDMTVDEGTLYGIGRLVLYAGPAAAFTPDEQLADLEAALRAGRIRRFALANPEHAPYGRAARAALQARGLWRALEPRLVLGENVSQAAQFALGGDCDGGIFALSLALSPALADRGTWVRLPDTLHPPLRQRMVLLRRAGPAARDFHAFLLQPAAREVFERYGFALPAP